MSDDPTPTSAWRQVLTLHDFSKARVRVVMFGDRLPHPDDWVAGIEAMKDCPFPWVPPIDSRFIGDDVLELTADYYATWKQRPMRLLQEALADRQRCLEGHESDERSEMQSQCPENGEAK